MRPLQRDREGRKDHGTVATRLGRCDPWWDSGALSRGSSTPIPEDQTPFYGNRFFRPSAKLVT